MQENKYPSVIAQKAAEMLLERGVDIDYLEDLAQFISS